MTLMQLFRRTTTMLAALLTSGCLMPALMGCAGKDATFDQRQQALAGSMDVLRQARFKGSVRFNEGGSPFGLNAATNWSLGPQQMTFAVEGDVDFTQAPRGAEPVDVAARAALMRLPVDERAAFLNSGGLPGVTFDAPLAATAKGITPPPKPKEPELK